MGNEREARVGEPFQFPHLFVMIHRGLDICDRSARLVERCYSIESGMNTSYIRQLSVCPRLTLNSKRWALLFSFCLLLSEGTVGFTTSTQRFRLPILQSVLFAKASKKKKSGGRGSAAGIKGFGSTAPKTKANVETDRSKQARAFYEFLDKNGAGDNLKRTALGFFLLPSGDKLRGVVALKDIKKGDDIINIPYELAVNLGPEGEDPTLPALELLRDYCEIMSSGEATPKRAYFEMLPPFGGSDCLGSTDFFSDEALEALQSPLIVEETLRRRDRTRKRFEELDDESFPNWIDGSRLTEQCLRWAVWLITSRVLTVQGNVDENKSYRLLIPYLDMCNHDRSSKHILMGRAVPGESLRVVAGANVKAGEQVNICYGGGVAGNDRFIQDYGFLDSSKEAFDIVAQQIMGKRRIQEGASAGKTMSAVDRDNTLGRLRDTTKAEDKATMESTSDAAVRAAIEYRLGVKESLSKFTEML